MTSSLYFNFITCKIRIRIVPIKSGLWISLGVCKCLQWYVTHGICFTSAWFIMFIALGSHQSNMVIYNGTKWEECIESTSQCIYLEHFIYKMAHWDIRLRGAACYMQLHAISNSVQTHVHRYGIISIIKAVSSWHRTTYFTLSNLAFSKPVRAKNPF